MNYNSNSLAPADLLWFDTYTKTLKFHDGKTWQDVSPSLSSSLLNNRIDLTNPTNSSDYNLQVGQEAIINFSNATNIALRIATQSGSLYHLYLFLTSPDFKSGNGLKGTSVSLLPNNTTYSSAFYRAGILRDSNGNAGTISGSISSFDLVYDMYPAVCFATIYNHTTHKVVMTESVHSGYDSNNYARMQREVCVWNDTTTNWTSLGTITLPSTSSGYILIRRLA